MNDKLQNVLSESANKAMKGGISGASAMALQVGTLMWLRTTINYQYRHGVSTSVAFKNLYKAGGVRRFYRGVGPALLQAPLSRFGDTAANIGVLTLLNSYPETEELPVLFKSICASGAAALWRINIMPIDTLKTSLQVNGKTGLSTLMTKYRQNGFRVFYHGSLGAFGATYVGHFPWFATFNYLDSKIPEYDNSIKNFSRNAGIGFSASVVSDTCSNSIRVLKTTKQTYETPITYLDAAKQIIKNDGIMSLFGRGLKTRIIANGAQGMMFTVLWKYMMEKME
jgi:hypothetical protein